WTHACRRSSQACLSPNTTPKGRMRKTTGTGAVPARTPSTPAGWAGRARTRGLVSTAVAPASRIPVSLVAALAAGRESAGPESEGPETVAPEVAETVGPEAVCRPFRPSLIARTPDRTSTVISAVWFPECRPAVRCPLVGDRLPPAG